MNLIQRLPLRAVARSLVFGGLIALAAAGGWHLAPSELQVAPPAFSGH